MGADARMGLYHSVRSCRFGLQDHEEVVMDWYTDYVGGAVVNAHTHGFEEVLGHLDFQIVGTSADRRYVQHFFNDVYNRIKKGTRFEEGDVIPDLIEDNHGVDHDVHIEKHQECGRDVLRLIFPDPQWRYPDDPQCASGYSLQSTHQT